MLSISNVSKILGGETLYSNASFQVYPGEKVGIVGPNGTGKSTLFRMIIKEERVDEGQISFPEKLRLAYFSQSVGEMKGKSALQEVMDGDLKIKKLQEQLLKFEDELADYEKVSEKRMDQILFEMGEVQTEFTKA